MRNKLVCLLLVSSMFVSFVACGKEVDTNKEKESNVSSSEEKTNDGGEEESFDPMAPYEETVKVSLGAIASKDRLGPDGGTMEDNPVKDYIEEKLNIEYEYAFEQLENSSVDQLSLAIAANDIPDIITPNYATILELNESGMLADLTEAWDKYASEDLKAMYDSYSYNVNEKVTIDGKLVAIGRCCPEPEGFLWIRQDWVDKLGISLDEDGDQLLTFDEIEMLAKEFVDKDPGNSGDPIGISCCDLVVGQWSIDLGLYAFSNAFGVYNQRFFRAEDGTVYNGGLVPEAKDALKWFRDMYEKGLLDPQLGVRSMVDAEATIINGQCGIWAGEMNNPSWAVTGVFEEDEEAYLRCYGIDNGKGQANTPIFDMVNRFVCVNSEFEHPEVVIKLMNLTVDIQNNPNLEQEAPEVYEYRKADPVSKFIDITGIENYPSNNFMQRYMDARDYLAGKITLDDVAPNLRPDIELVDKYNADPNSLSAAEMGSYTWTMEGSRLATELNEAGLMNYVSPVYIQTETRALREADLNTLETETWVKIITGEEPLEYFDTFVEEWYKLGGQEIIDELNEALK